MGTQYTLTLSSEQAHAVDKAVELLLRLKLGQYEELPWALMDLNTEGFGEKSQNARALLQAAFCVMHDGVWQKDQEWHRLYDIHQVVRKAIHDVEHPGTIGVDAYDPICTSGEPLPKIKVEE